MSFSVSNQLWDLETSNSSWTEIQAVELNAALRTFHVRAELYAFDLNGDAFMCDIKAMVRRGASGGVVPLFSAVYQLLNTQKTLGALTWDVRARADGNFVRFEVRNPGGGNVFWNLDGYYGRCMEDDSYVP